MRYYGADAYLILYHSFSELYTVLDMNRQQLVTLTILDAHGMACGVDCRDGLTCFWFRYIQK